MEWPSWAKLGQHGKCKILCNFKNRRSITTFLVTEGEGPAINGLPTALARQELQNVPWISNLHESFHFQSQHPDSPLVRARQGEHSF